MANKLIDEAISALVERQEERRPVPIEMGVYVGDTLLPDIFFSRDGYYFEILPFKQRETTVHEIDWRIRSATHEIAKLAGGGLLYGEHFDYTSRNALVAFLREGYYTNCILIAIRRKQDAPWIASRGFIRVNRTLLEVIHGGKKLPERDELQENTL